MERILFLELRAAMVSGNRVLQEEKSNVSLGILHHSINGYSSRLLMNSTQTTVIQVSMQSLSRISAKPLKIQEY